MKRIASGVARRTSGSLRGSLRLVRPSVALLHTTRSLNQQQPNKDNKKKHNEPQASGIFGQLLNFVGGMTAEPLRPDIRLHIKDVHNVVAIKQVTAIYEFMISSYFEESLEFRSSPQTNADAAVVADRVIQQFKKKFPTLPVPTRADIADYYKLVYLMLVEEKGVEQLVYEDAPLVDDLKVIWALKEEGQVKFEEGVDSGSVSNLADVARDFGVSQECVEEWFKFFKVLDSIPIRHDVQNALNPPALENRKKLETLGIMQPFLTQSSTKGKPTSGSSKSAKSGPSGNSKKEDQRTINIDIDADKLAKYAFIASSFLLCMYIFSLMLDTNQEISFQEFTSKFLVKNYVKKLVVINNKTASIELNETGSLHYSSGQLFYFQIGSIEAFERNLRNVQDELEISDQIRVPVVYVSEGNTSKMLINFLPTLLFLGAIYYMTKKAGGMGGMGGPLGFGKSTAKKFNQETDVKIRFKDVAGMSEAKEEVMEFVKFLQNPEKYEKLGAKIPRGAILSGPPGTGKTLIAKATAGEAGVPFYSVSGSEFVEMFVGVGASRVRDLFKTARQNAPSIVFVDEIDAIGKQRSKGNASGANDERETTLNQLLVEMDGFDSNDHVVVLAGTNRADILDKALMRPGRFDRHIGIDNPELLGRKEIFEVHLKKIKMVDNIDEDLSGRLAALTPGFLGADIANVCNESALIAARYNADAVTLRHFELAIERVIGGIEKKSKLLNTEEQKIVAYHEAGHAVCGWYLKYASPLLKVSIIPRGQGALGYAQYLPPDQYLLSGLQLNDRMIMTLGGRVSEELNFKSVTSGGHDDFKKVTGIAQLMVMRFGMSPKVGMVNYADTRDSDDLAKPYSEETNRIIDEEVQRIVSECYEACKELLTTRSSEVKLVAEELLKKEFITREDMIRLLGKRPFPETNDAFDKYLDGKPAYKNIQPNNESKDQDVE